MSERSIPPAIISGDNETANQVKARLALSGIDAVTIQELWDTKIELERTIKGLEQAAKKRCEELQTLKRENEALQAQLAESRAENERLIDLLDDIRTDLFVRSDDRGVVNLSHNLWVKLKQISDEGERRKTKSDN